MTQSVQEFMTTNVVCVQSNQMVTEAAKLMRNHNVGDVMVLDGDTVCGILTDRDIVVRALAQGFSENTTVDEICTHDLQVLHSTDTIDQAVQLMRANSVRRLPVVEDGHALGVVSLGDLAQQRDPYSVLGEVSAAPPQT